MCNTSSVQNMVPADGATSSSTTSGPIHLTTISIAEQAEQTTLYKVAMVIHYYWLPVAVPVGLVGNCLAAIVLLQRHNRKTSCCLYMAALAVSDTGVLLDAAYFWIATVGLKHTGYVMSDFDCKFMAYAVAVAFFNGVLLILSMTVDRFIAIRFPLKAILYCTPKRAKISIVVIFLGAVLYAIPQIFMARMVGQSACASYSADFISTKIYSWVSFCTNCFLPFFIILVLNIGIIQAIRGRSKYFEQQNKDGNVGNPRGKTCQGVGPPVPEKQDSQLTAMLLLVTFAFLILTLPQYTRYAVFSIYDYRNSVHDYSIYILCFHISNKCYYTNSAVNFFLYCIGGSKFRRDLLRLCQQKSKKPLVHSVSSISTP